MPHYVYLGDEGSSAEVVVQLQTVKEGITTDQFADSQTRLGAEEQVLDFYEKHSSEEVTLAGNVRSWEVAETWKRPENDFFQRGKEYFFVAGGTGYSIYTQAERSEWAAVEPAIDEIIASFTLDVLAASAPPAVIPTTTSQPTATVSPVASVYTSKRYWYTIEVPSGWRIDSSNDASVQIWEPNTLSVVWVSVSEIDPKIYPTLDAYVRDWRPVTASAWTDFQVIWQERILKGQPIEAHEFTYTFTFDGTRRQGIQDWYVLGKYLVRVIALSTVEVWGSQKYSGVRNELETILRSFEPTSHTTTQYGYSVAHPPNWIRRTSLELDYWTVEPLGNRQMWIWVYSARGYTNVLDYGASSTVTNADVVSRGLVFSARPNPSYRIDFTAKGRRGATLITLRLDKAIWVFVSADVDEWPELEPLVEDIFLRMAVTPNPSR